MEKVKVVTTTGRVYHITYDERWSGDSMMSFYDKQGNVIISIGTAYVEAEIHDESMFTVENRETN